MAVADPDVQPDAAVTAVAIMVTVMSMAAVMTVMPVSGQRLAAQAETEQRNGQRDGRQYMSQAQFFKHVSTSCA
jgi:hypothetical protein